MNETLTLILSLSLSGSILAVLILLLKPFIKDRLSKSVQYYIWLVVLLRLVIPFSFDESIVNRVFVNNSWPHAEITNQEMPSSILPSVETNVTNGVYNQDSDHQRFLNDLFSQYLFYLWLLGVIIVLFVNITGYVGFSRALNKNSRPAEERDKRILHELAQGKRLPGLVRNRWINTPMLMGFLKPVIVIPDLALDDKQLVNILRHELTHLRRFDIVVKWFTLIVVSIHWFNPFIYFIKKEMNQACEFACDEAVIRGFSNAEKQSYGDTLIAVVAENNVRTGFLQATMSEQKKTLKDRLQAIMAYKTKSKFAVSVSVLLLLAAIGTAVFLGAHTNSSKEVIYRNEPFGFTLNLTKEFADGTEIRDEGNVVYFVDKEISKSSPDMLLGVVGRIEIYNKSTVTRKDLRQNEDIYGYQYLGESRKYYYGWAQATDVQIPPGADEKVRSHYRSLEEQFRELVQTLKAE